MKAWTMKALRAKLGLTIGAVLLLILSACRSSGSGALAPTSGGTTSGSAGTATTKDKLTIMGVTSLGSGTHMLSSYLLTKNGVSVDQAQFVPVGAGDTFIAAIKQGHIDAGMTTEPTVSRLLQTGDAQVLVDMRTPTTARAA